MTTRYILLLSVVGLFTRLSAQPYSLHAEEMLPAGSQYALRDIQNLPSVDLTTGTGVVWNHSDLVPTGDEQIIAIVEPQGTPYASTFPLADYCLSYPVSGAYYYYELSPDSFAQVGYYSNSTLYTYSDPDVKFVFPLEYDGVHSDTWDHDQVQVPGISSYTVIGAGTLQLPMGNFDDVLLLHTEVTSQFTNEQYIWVDANSGAYLMRFTPEGAFPMFGRMITSLQTGLEERAALPDVRLHSVVNGQLGITYRSGTGLAYRITDVAGRLMTTGTLPPAAQPNTRFVAMDELGSGVHLIEFISPSERRTERFLME